MSLPEHITVKISSESVEAIGLTPVVVQQITLEELVRLMLGITGKDVNRVREILLRGSLVSGGSRFRWQGVETGAPELEQFLDRYPDSDPTRPFDAAQCFQAVLRGAPRPLLIERTAGEKRRMFRGRSFWGELISLIGAPQYVEYSYREQADVYRVKPAADLQQKLRDAAGLLAYSSFEAALRDMNVQSVDLFVRR